MRVPLFLSIVVLAAGCVTTSGEDAVRTAEPAARPVSALPAGRPSSPGHIEPPVLTPTEREEIRQAHLAALAQEIARLETLLSGDRQEDDAIATFISRLSEEKARLEREDPASYTPSSWVDLEGSFTGPFEFGQLFYYEGMTRSGPFYHLAGLKDGALSALREERPYRILAAVLCRRYYPFPSSYIFVYRWEALR
ncbi:hypothetical protein [Spirochaeta thermophila]|uniref:Lipoprotein n=1 Tax=Winmispira thermophila (strain ATCC 49972 / DSM 6192 / RI 19.B1) TaxID=665571 RepID=E0RQ40_WINT6|nr:hypothetical protein [Spirochaeta thermophila]ADN01424.1 hypothetical protein STHERM_c04520 [Spirochaeta thermophila DSM 6192]